MSTAVTHIRIDENGVAWIEGTTVKVIEVAIDKIAYGSSPEEMHFQYHQIEMTIGECMNDLELIAKGYEPEDLLDRVEYLPLK